MDGFSRQNGFFSMSGLGPASSGPTYPGNLFGIPHTVWTSAMAGSEVTFDGDDVLIAAGVGNDYRSILALHDTFNVEGATIRAWFDHKAGVLGSVQLLTPGQTPSSTNFTQDETGRYVAEYTVPSGGLTTVTAVITSADAADPVRVSKLHYAVSPPDATEDSPQPDVLALQQWLQSGKAEFVGNQWPPEKVDLEIAAADASEAGAVVWGFLARPTQRKFILGYATWPGGEPAIFDRGWLSLQGLGSSVNVFVKAMADHPGVFGGYAYVATGLTTATRYAELTLDNAQAIAAYTQDQVTVQNLQVFDEAPTDFSAPASLSFPDDEIVVDHQGEITAVHCPIFEGTGREYFSLHLVDYTNESGGGNCLRDMLYSRRTGSQIFQPVRQFYQSGQNEFAILLDTDVTSNFVGGFFHGYQNERASPLFELDTGAGFEAASLATLGKFTCAAARRTDYSEFYEHGTSNVAGILDTTKTFEPGRMTLHQRLEFAGDYDVYGLYLFKLSFFRYLDGLSALGETFDTFTLPNDGDASYTPSATNQPYDRYRMSGQLLDLDIEVTSGWSSPPAESFFDFSSNEIQPYFAPLGAHYSPFNSNSSSPVSVVAEQVVEMTTVMRWSKP